MTMLTSVVKAANWSLMSLTIKLEENQLICSKRMIVHDIIIQSLPNEMSLFEINDITS